MKRSILTTLVLTCALCVGGPLAAFAKEGHERGKGGKHHGGSPVDGALAKMTLTDEQKSKVQAIKEKFHTEMKKWEADHKAEMDAAKAAHDRQKMKPLMEQRQTKMEGMIAEIKNVLNEDQKTQLQQALDAAKAEHGKHGKKH
ncbi:MAG: hypothetical protein HZA91_06835 [Verrucomicrobia bacterium]|nr:hypothetical protein [Verrucomicrobiota bacterium]